LANSVTYVKRATHKRRGGDFSFKDARGDGHWVEVPICVPSLRLRGRIDFLERNGDDIKIVDLKSGRIKNSDGEVKPKIALQLLLYGIMAQFHEPRAHLTLVVNNGTVHFVPFDSEVVEDTKGWLQSTMSNLAPGALVSAEKLANIGPDCRWCDTRHHCRRYLQESPDLWSQEIDWRMPLDTWGTVEQIIPKRNGLFDLNLLDAGGRHIKVFRVREIHLKDITIGNHVWFFGLAASRTALGGNSWSHPLNFHEIGESNAKDRAWSLQIFTGPS
jgi:hypothetical protein